MEKPNVGRAILGGLVATLVMTMIMYAAPMMGMPKMDVAAMLGSMLNGGQMPASMSGPWVMGMMMHLFDGIIVFPLIYAFLLFRMLPGSPLLRGVIWGLILWLLSQAMVMPMMGSGFFSANAPNRMMTVIGSLMGHIIYGAILGGIAKPAGSSVSTQVRHA